jgi:FkbM family methyltransferase
MQFRHLLASYTLSRRTLRYATRICELIGADQTMLSLQVLDQRMYGEPEFNIVHRFCDRTKASIDIGAANGLYLFALRDYSARCIGFEPNPFSYQDLSKRFSGVRLENCALSDASGKVELRVPIVDKMLYSGFGTIEAENSLSAFSAKSLKRIVVEVKTLDSFQFTDVGLIKIDVEGHEWDVIQGAIVTIDRSRPNLLIEIEDRHKKGNLVRMVEFFKKREYGIYFLKDGRLRDIAEFDLEKLQNADGPIKPGLYFNNFFFLNDPRKYEHLLVDA